jgi:hypothetical protein
VSGLGLEFGFSGPKCSRVSHALSVRKCVPGSENQTVGPLRTSGYPRRPGPQPGRDRNPGPCWDAYHVWVSIGGVGSHAFEVCTPCVRRGSDRS